MPSFNQSVQNTGFAHPNLNTKRTSNESLLNRIKEKNLNGNSQIKEFEEEKKEVVGIFRRVEVATFSLIELDPNIDADPL